MTLTPLIRGATTLLIGAPGGLTFFFLNLPLPWVLGKGFTPDVLARSRTSGISLLAM